MNHLFITSSGIESPRWRQAFPNLQLQGYVAPVADLGGGLVWVVVAEGFRLELIPQWVAAGAKVIALTATENPQQARQLLAQGASGYLHYLAAVPVLQQVSQVVQVGGLWLGAELMRELVLATANALAHLPSEPVGQSPRLELLTQRERAVAEAIAAGKTNKEAARDLDITERTVKAHLGSVFEKLQVRDRLQLVLVMSGR